jgi:uncharacterized protein DUF5916/cellulose/xylan binding protein with CBM9 domain
MLLPLLATLIADSTAAPPVYHGWNRQIDVQIPRVEATVVIDGLLDEAVWQEAAVLTGFSHFAPTDGAPADDSTEVRVWYGQDAIYFGVTAFEAHGEVRATLADRDRIWSDDYVQILLGTFNDRRQAFMFSVNPFGVQGDGALVERGTTSTGGFNAISQAREAADLSPDYVFASKGLLIDGGYQVEIRIPFKSLRYQARDKQVWALQVLRLVQHSGYEDTWAPASRASASFLGQSGQLEGLTGLERGLVLDVTPELTHKVTGRRVGGSWDYHGEGPDIGGTVRWGITNNLTFNGTANPDFSQVESDASQTNFNPRDAIFFPEKRPFFLEGIELFSTPNQLVYSRRIVQPVAAAKLAGKAVGTDIGLISAVDDQVGSLSQQDHPVYNILRVQRDVGAKSRVGLVYTDREDGDNTNRVGGVDTRLVFGVNSLGLQYARAWDRSFGVSNSASLWDARFIRSSRHIAIRYVLDGVSPDFVTRSGFIRRRGDTRLDIVHGLNIYGKPGSLVENFTPDISLHGVWNYDDFVAGRGIRDDQIHFNLNAALRGGWTAGFSLLLEKFRFDEAIYGNYAIEAPLAGGGLDTIPFAPRHELPNRDYVFSFGSPQFPRFSFNGFLIFGQDENFFEWSSAHIFSTNLNLTIRPSDQLRVQATYAQNQVKRRTDGSTVQVQRIPRLKLEYQIARPLFLRLVGEYNNYEQDDLRDDSRTGNPILIYDSGVGDYVKATAFSSNRFRGDVLVSFAPSPGTVLFAGYGSTMDDTGAFRFKDLRRANDGFFFKGSYLFRVGG